MLDFGEEDESDDDEDENEDQVGEVSYGLLLFVWVQLSRCSRGRY